MALSPVAATQLLSISISITQATRLSPYLGLLAYIVPDTLEGGGAGSTQRFTSANDVAVALAASEISSTTATNLLAALGQDQQPAAVYCIAKGAGTNVAALETAIDAGLDVGIIVLQSATEADQESIGAWLSSDNAYQSRFVFIVQSADPDLATATKPASLDDCEQFGCRMFYSADTEPVAMAFAGRLAASNLANGPTTPNYRIADCDVPTLSSTQIGHLNDNDVGYLQLLDYGADSTQILGMGVKSYDGSDWKGAVSLVYMARQLRAQLLAFWLNLGIAGTPLPADATGRGMVEAQAQAILGPMSAAGHFTASSTLPDGYSIATEVQTVGAEKWIYLYVDVLIAGQVSRIATSIQGTEV